MGLTGALPHAGASPRQVDPEAQRDKVRAEEQANSDYLNNLFSRGERMERDLAAQQRKISTASRQQRSAADQAKVAKRQEQAARAQIERLKAERLPLVARMRRVVVDAYITSGSASGWDMFNEARPIDAVQRSTMRDVVKGTTAVSNDELRASAQDLAAAQAEAADAGQRARAAEHDSARQVAALKKAFAASAKAQRGLEDEIDAVANQVEELRAIDAKLSEEIDRRNAEIARKLKAAEDAAAAQRRKAEQARIIAAAAVTAPPTTQRPVSSVASPPRSTTTATTRTPVPTSIVTPDPPVSEPTGNGPAVVTTTKPTGTEPPVTEPATTEPPAPVTEPPVTSPPPTTEPTGNYNSPFYVPGFPPPPPSWVPPASLLAANQTVTVGPFRVHPSIANNRCFTDERG